MSVTPNATDVKAIKKALEADYETVDEAAKAVAEVAFQQAFKAAKFFVRAEGWEGVFGPFRTLSEAEKVGLVLGERYKWHIEIILDASASDVRVELARAEKAEADRLEKQKEKLTRSVEKWCRDNGVVAPNEVLDWTLL